MRTRALLLAMTALPQAAIADEVFQLGVIEVNENAAQTALSDKKTITAEDINRHNHNDVATALNQLPGISIQNLGARNERMIYLRAYNSRQVPLFIDKTTNRHNLFENAQGYTVVVITAGQRNPMWRLNNKSGHIMCYPLPIGINWHT